MLRFAATGVRRSGVSSSTSGRRAWVTTTTTAQGHEVSSDNAVRLHELHRVLDEAEALPHDTRGWRSKAIVQASGALAAYYIEQCRWLEGEPAVRRYVDAVQAYRGSQHPVSAHGVAMLGQLLCRLHRYQEALPLLQQSSSSLLDVLRDDVSTATAFADLAHCQLMLGDVAAADDSWSQALAIRRRSMPSSSSM